MRTEQANISIRAGMMKSKTYHVSTPLQAGQEDNQSSDTQEATNKVDAADNLLPAESKRVGSRRREVEENRDQKTESTPRSTKGADIGASCCNKQ